MFQLSLGINPEGAGVGFKEFPSSAAFSCWEWQLLPQALWEREDSVPWVLGFAPFPQPEAGLGLGGNVRKLPLSPGKGQGTNPSTQGLHSTLGFNPSLDQTFSSPWDANPGKSKILGFFLSPGSSLCLCTFGIRSSFPAGVLGQGIPGGNSWGLLPPSCAWKGNLGICSVPGQVQMELSRSEPIPFFLSPGFC